MDHPAPLIAATDFSSGAQQALERAAQLAGMHAAPLIVAHAYNESLWGRARAMLGSDAASLREPELWLRERLADTAADLQRRFGMAARTALLSGRPAPALAELARREGARMIVAGSHGDDWIDELLLGPTSLRILAASPCPVLIVRKPPLTAYAEIVIATDFSTAAHRAARLATELAPSAAKLLLNVYAIPCEGRLRLAGLTDADLAHSLQQAANIASRDLAAFAAECPTTGGADYSLRAVHGQAAPMILDIARRAGADLIAIGRHGLSAIDEALLGSVPQNVLHHAECDVLLVP